MPFSIQCPMYILSKSTYIRGLQCEKSLYLHKKRSFLRDPLPAAQRAKFKRGHDVGFMAQKMFPEGIDCSPGSPAGLPKAAIRTMEYIQQGAVTLYEAVFIYDDVVIMLDILHKTEQGWIATEVKSSLSLSDTYFEDAALQYYVMKGAGIDPADFFLMYVNGDFVKDDTELNDRFFTRQSCLTEVKQAHERVGQRIQALKGIPSLPHSPEILPGVQCTTPYPCDFTGHCWKNIPKPWVSDLWTVSGLIIQDWLKRGILSFKDIPEDELHHMAEAEKRAILSQNRQIQIALLPSWLFDEDIPFVYLTHAGIAPAMPLYTSTSPYQYQIYSVHIRYRTNKPPAELYIPADSLNPEILRDFLKEHLPENSIILSDDANGLSAWMEINAHDLMQSLNVVGIFDVLQTEAAFFPFNRCSFNRLMIEAGIAEKMKGDPDALEVFLQTDYTLDKPQHQSDCLQHLRWKTASLASCMEYLKEKATE